MQILQSYSGQGKSLYHFFKEVRWSCFKAGFIGDSLNLCITVEVLPHHLNVFVSDQHNLFEL